MSRMFTKKIGLGVLTLLITALFVGCEPKGPAQQAGENIDKAGKDLKNAVDPRGPAERAGDAIDRATGK